MSEDELMSKIKHLNDKLEEICQERDTIIEKLYAIRYKKRRTEEP